MADVAKHPSSSTSDSRRRDGASGSSSSSSSRPSSSSSSRDAAKSSSSSSNGSSATDAMLRRGPPGKDATPEERAQWEIERKKIQKYKEDKLKARRDHTRMILESHAQAKRRALLGKQSEFLANLEFRNVLPDLPFDTKFVQYPHEPDRLIKYKPNTLEMDYTYEVHEDTNLGLDIDLIDPAKYEAPENPGPLEVGDEQVLMMKEVNNRNTKAKVRPTVTWLRRTEYMGTDLSETTHKFKSEVEIQTALREGTESALAEVVSLSLEDKAEASFRDVSNPSAFVHPSNKKLKVAKVWDVFPDQLLSANKYAIVAYDLLPSHDLKGKNVSDRENRALLCGLDRKNTEIVQGSLLLPNARDEEEKDSDEPQTEKFGYFRDYQAAIDNLESRVDSQHVMFVLDPASNQFTYTDVVHRIQLRKTKLASDDKRRRGSIVHRRPYSEGELERRNAVRFDYGGLYDEALDDEEHIRDYKRQRGAAAASNGDADESKSDNDDTTANGADSPAISDSDSD